MKKMIEAWEIKVQSLNTFASSIEKMCLNENMKGLSLEKMVDIFNAVESGREILIKEYGILELEGDIADLEIWIINHFRNGYGARSGASGEYIKELCEHNPLIPIERREAVGGIVEYIKESIGSKEEK